MDKLETSQAAFDDHATAWVETPAGLDNVPFEVRVQDAPRSETLEQDAREYLELHPSLFERARTLGHDIVAVDERLLFGAGLALTLGAGAIVLWAYNRHGKRKN